MIEIKPFTKKNEDGNDAELYINDELIPISRYSFSLDKDRKSFYLTVKGNEIINKIIPFSLKEFPLYIDTLAFYFLDDEIDIVNSIYIGHPYKIIDDPSDPSGKGYFRDEKKDEFYISFQIADDLTLWNHQYNVKDYYEELYRLSEQFEEDIEIGLNDNESIQYGFSIQFHYKNIEKPIAKEIEERLKIIQRFHQEADKKLIARKYENSVAITIDVPAEMIAPYEQYLIYFSQFLKDIGVDADSELHHEAGQILFSVTPTNSDEALDKIRAALELYLHLPSGSINDDSENVTSIEVQRLNANIHHLKSQLSLAGAEKQLNEAVIQAKDATIQALSYTVKQQSKLLSGDISSAIIDITPPLQTKEKEELIEGIVSLTKYEGQGFEINLAEIFRRLKEIFKKK